MDRDWDRHFDQWRWAIIDTGGITFYKPIAKDRDQAFFYSDGSLMEWATRRKLPFLKGFRHDIPKIKYLGFSASNFDRVFMNDLDKNDWSNMLSRIQGKSN